MSIIANSSVDSSKETRATQPTSHESQQQYQPPVYIQGYWMLGCKPNEASQSFLGTACGRL
ncbi:hypothetical protein PCANC_03102 [Puccinia coronata f. sp. avenae]|uniref:Uncharacterized protein n=1 Tax=Puccinia coronata f. sp. avenae TaxID=200324 RepID=A0A2N5W4N8_9BASI|nr:hypothetical protein PCANC_03102 [Puccinia coronata f. sp. avenae]